MWISKDLAVKSVALLASDEAVKWSQADGGLKIAASQAKIDSAAIAYEIRLK